MSISSSVETNELALKFLFANQDGVNVVLKFQKNTQITTVKQRLIENWPEKVAPPDNLKSIRLICMGRGMLQDKETIESSKIPSYPTYPTPVNVSVARALTSTVKDKKAQPEIDTTNPKSPTADHENSTPVPTRNPDAGCACIIS